MTQAFKRFFSLDSAKAIKAQKYGYLNAINYMAPHKAGGAGNLCAHASPGCIDLCLGEHSGNAALYASVKASRAAKAQYFMRDRAAFLNEAAAHIRSAIVKSRKAKLKLCVRMNGSSDIAFEAVHSQGELPLVLQFPRVQFVDYTKNPLRMMRFCRGELPRNLHLTFSRSETNEAQCLEVLKAGGNVAVVSALPRPQTYLEYPTIDGDKHDLRHLDARNVIVWLSPKGNRAKKSTNGFVVR